MKKISFVIVALAVISLSSCYVEERGGYRYHHPFWHHREVENTIKPHQQNSATAPVDIYTAKK